MLIRIVLSIFVMCMISFISMLCYSIGMDNYDHEKLFTSLGIASLVSLGALIVAFIWTVVV